MSILFTNKDQRQLQLRKKIIDFSTTYNLGNSLPVDSINPNLIKDYLVVSKAFVSALKGKHPWKDIDKKVDDQHKAMDTSATKNLFYHMSSYSIDDTFKIKDSIPHDKIIQEESKLDSISYQHVTDRTKAQNSAALSIAKQSGITAFDLETLGDGSITDFHFEKIGPNGFDENNRTYFSSALGINKTQKQEYEEALDKYIQKGEEYLNDNEKITLKRLNKIGAQETLIEARDSTKALYRYRKLDDVSELSVERIKIGISRLSDMGMKQAASAVNGVRPAVQELLDGYFSSDVLGGHNIKEFDIPRIHNFFNDRDSEGNLRYVTQEEHEVFNKRLQKGQPLSLDSLQIAKRLEEETSLDVIQKQLRSPAFKKHRAKYNSQSGVIIRNGKADLLENASLHAAEHDTLLWVNGIYETSFVNGTVDVGAQSKTLKRGSILTVGNNFVQNKSLANGITYERDGLQQDIRFASGFVYRNGQESFVQNDFPVIGTKMNYMLGGISKFTTAADPSLEKIGLANKDLYVASLIPMIEGANQDPRYAKMQDSVFTIVAESEEELEDRLSNFVYVGQRGSVNAKSTLAEIREEANKGIIPEDILSSGGMSPELKKITEMYDQASGDKIDRDPNITLNQRSSTKLTEDLITRRLRGSEYSFWKKHIELSDKIKNNTSVSMNDMIEIVSYVHDGKKYYQSNSIRNLAYSRQYAQVLEPFARAAAQRVQSYKYGKDRAFSFIYEHMLDELKNKAGIASNIHSTVPRELSVEDMNTFDIDISELIHKAGKVSQEIDPYEIQHPNIVSIRMDKIDNKFASQVIRAIYGNDAKNIESTERMKILHDVMKLLNKNVDKDLFSKKEISEVISEESNELGIVSFIGSKLKERVDNLRGQGKNTEQHLYSRNKQTLDKEAMEFVKQGIVVKNQTGDYELSSVFGSVEEYADRAAKAYRKENIKKQESISSKIESILDDILFKESEVSRQELMKFGYSKEQADFLLKQRMIRRQDTKELLEATLGTLFSKPNPKASLTYDKETGIISVISQGEQIEADISAYLPKDVFDRDTGRFYTRLGGMDIVNPIGLVAEKDYKTGELSKLTFGTAMKQGLKDRGWIKYTILSGIDEGTPVENLISALKDLNKYLRTSVQGPGTSAYADLRPVIENLPFLISKGVVTDKYVDERLIETGLDLVGKDLSVSKGIGVSFYNLAWDNMRGVLKSIAANGKNLGILDPNVVTGDITELADSIVIGDKPNAHGFAETVTVEGVVTRDNRGIGSATQRAMPIDVDSIDDDIVDAPKGLRKDVKSVSNFFRTRAEANRDSRGKEYRPNVIVKRLNIHHTELLDRIKKEKRLSEATKRILGRNIYTAESGGIINPYLMDTVFKDQVSDQKINFKELADLDRIDKEDLPEELKRRKKQAYHIEYDDVTGEYKFRYGIGRYVQTNDTIAITFDNYTGFQAAKAKHEGIVKTVFFDKRTKKAASEEMINLIVADWVKQNQATIKAAKDRREIISLISSHLSGIFDRKIINKAFSANTYAKMIENQAEKGMRFSPIAGLGDIDPRISDFLKRIGANDLTGRGLSIDALKHLFGGEDDFRALAAYLGKEGEANSSADIRKAIKDIFGEDKKALINAIMGERYQPFEEFSRVILGKQGENVGIISNNAADALKHNEARGAMNYLFAQIQGLEDPTIRNKFLKRINSENVFGKGNAVSYSQDKGFIINKGIDQINVGKLQHIIKDVTGQDIGADTYNYFNGQNGVSYYDRVLLSRAEDHEKASYASTGKGFKYTRRDADNMIANTYDKESLARARQIIGKATGDTKFAENVFAGRGESGVVYHDALLNLKNKIFAQDYNNLVLKNGKIQNKKLHAFAQEKGLDESHLKGIVSRIGTAQNGVSNIDTSYLEKAYMADMHFVARDYNLDTGRVSDNRLKKYNFQSMKIGNLVTSKGSNELFESNMFGKNLLIDLSEIGLTTSKGKSKLAIPILATGYMAEDKEVTSEILNKLAGLNSRAKEYLKLDESDEVARATYQRSMQKSLSQIESLLESRHGKEGPVADLSSARFLYSSSSSKSQIIDLAHLGENAPNWKFRGKSIAEMAQNGLEVNAAFVSEDRLRSMLGQEYFDTLKKAGISDEEWLKHVEEHGVIGTINRKPSAYKGSMSTARIYLDRTMKADQTKITQGLAYPMHNDLDGDILGVSVVTEAGKTTKGNIVAIDSATQEILSSRRNNNNANLVLSNKSLDFIGRRMKRIDDSTLYESATTGHTFLQSVHAPNLTPAELPKQDLLRGFLVNGTYYSEAFGANRENLEKSWEALGQHNDFRDIINKKSKMELLDFKTEIENQIAKTFGKGSNAKQYEAALGHYLNEEFSKRATMAYAGKEGTGLVNYHAQKFRSVLSAMIQSGENPLTARQEHIINTSLITLEDKFFGAKNAGRDMSQALDTLGSATEKAFRAGESDPTELINFLVNDFDILNEKWMTKSFGNSQVTKEEFIDAWNAFVPKGKGFSAAVREMLKTGMGTGKNASSVTHYFSGEYDAAAVYFDSFSKEAPDLVENVDEVFSKGNPQTFDSGSVSFPDMTSSKKAQKGMKDSFVDALKNTRVSMKSGLARNAVGLAGAIMLTGFIGGNPSRDEHEIAMNNQMAHQKNPGYVPSMNQYNQKQMNNPSGYKINVKASSPYNSRQSAAAVNQSFSQHTRGNINMNMNINNRGQGPSRREMDDYFDRAI